MAASRLTDAFAETARVSRHDRAFTFLDSNLRAKTYTYRELFTEVEAIAQRMSRVRSFDASGPTAILLRSQEAQILHYLAALRVGLIPAILTPPNPKLNQEYYLRTTSEVLRRSSFAAIITDLPRAELPVPVHEPYTIHPLGSARSVNVPRGPVLPENVPFLQYSSGTTGIKRGVVVTEKAVLAQLRTYAAALDLNEGDRVVSWLPLYHDMGFIACLNLPLLFGIHTVIIDPIDWVTQPALLIRALSMFQGTLAWNPNFAYAFMSQRIRDRDLNDLDLSRLRALVNCSEPVTYASQMRFLDRFRSQGLREDVFAGCYAMAETTFALTHGGTSAPESLDHIGPVNVSRPSDEPYVSVGEAIEGVELRMIDSSGRECSEREIGEILVRSPFTFSGYHNDPEATRRAFADGWYRTGDLGYRIGDRNFVTGRAKDVLIVGGVNVFPSDLEDITSEVEGIQPGRTVAFSHFDPRLQTERITILAESDLAGAMAQDATLEIRKRILAAFQIANFEAHLVPSGWLVKSSSGKIARAANREKWDARLAGH